MCDTVCARGCVLPEGKRTMLSGQGAKGLEARIHMVSFSVSQWAASLEVEPRMIIEGPNPTLLRTCEVGPVLGVV